MMCGVMTQTDQEVGSEMTKEQVKAQGKIKTQLLTSFAATLLDPFRVRDVVMTSFAVVKCSKISTVSVCWVRLRS